MHGRCAISNRVTNEFLRYGNSEAPGFHNLDLDDDDDDLHVTKSLRTIIAGV